MIARVVGVIVCPRFTMAKLVRQPAWLKTWILILVVYGSCGTWLLSTEAGQQAVIDERVRSVEIFGGHVQDAQYAALRARPPWWIYFIGGSRSLLSPPATLVVALGCWAASRYDGASAGLTQSLAIAVHANVVLAMGQLVATPLQYLRESLTPVLTLAAVLPLMEEGTLPARFFGSIEILTIWWMTLLAIGLVALTHRPLSRYLTALATLYAAYAAILAVAIAAIGGL